MAVVVRGDGSACVYYPSGDLAASLDPDNTTSSSTGRASGGGGKADGSRGSSAGGGRFRLLAMYAGSNGNVAASYDSGGGFVQYPSGALALLVSGSSGLGTHYNPGGAVLRRWHLRRCDDGMESCHMGLAACGPCTSVGKLWEPTASVAYHTSCG